jgi:tetratricopeptide (TPR) repeat protein
MGDKHPTVEELQGFLRCATDGDHAARNALVVRHLLAGCAACGERLGEIGWPESRLARLVQLSGLELEEQGGAYEPLALQYAYNYDRAFDRASQSVENFLAEIPPPAEATERLLAELDAQVGQDLPQLVARDERFLSPELVHSLIERSHGERYKSPERMLHWGNLARGIAEHCTTALLGSAAKLADLRARAWGQFGNALRVSGRLREAEKAMASARGYVAEGTGDPVLRARLLEQMGSLNISTRRFDAALGFLDDAAAIHRELGDNYSIARVLVHKAFAALNSGEAASAVRALHRAIPLIESQEDPHLLLAACHNLVRCYIDLDRPEQALSLYSETHDLYKDLGDSLIVLRAAWQEGMLLRDLGQLGNAETVLLQARKGFTERNLPYEVAVISLDLAAVYAKLGCVEKLKQTVAEALPIFRALRIDRDGLAALLQLGQVAGQERQALQLIRLIAARLEQIQA